MAESKRFVLASCLRHITCALIHNEAAPIRHDHAPGHTYKRRPHTKRRRPCPSQHFRPIRRIRCLRSLRPFLSLRNERSGPIFSFPNSQAPFYLSSIPLPTFSGRARPYPSCSAGATMSCSSGLSEIFFMVGLISRIEVYYPNRFD